MAQPREKRLERDVRREFTRQLLDRLASATGAERREIEDELIAHNLVVAHDVARRYHGRGIAAEDLDQVACMGLVRAVRGYDLAKATDFLGYVVPTIRGEVRRHFRDHGWTVRPPRSIQELQPRVVRARGELWQRLGRAPRPDEIAGELGVEPQLVRQAVGADGCFTPASVDATPDEGVALADRLGSGDPGYTRVEARLSLGPMIRGLDHRERRILEMRFWLGCTQAEIGAEIGVTQMQVSRLLSGLLARLRDELTDAA